MLITANKLKSSQQQQHQPTARHTEQWELRVVHSGSIVQVFVMISRSSVTLAPVRPRLLLQLSLLQLWLLSLRMSLLLVRRSSLLLLLLLLLRLSLLLLLLRWLLLLLLPPNVVLLSLLLLPLTLNLYSSFDLSTELTSLHCHTVASAVRLYALCLHLVKQSHNWLPLLTAVQLVRVHERVVCECIRLHSSTLLHLFKHY
jgi:hypothetical protein